MAALVTGGTGFLGSLLVSQLLEQGEQVYALVRGKRDGSSHDRLVRVLDAIGAPPTGAMSARLTVLEGDIKRPDLGLERTVFMPVESAVQAMLGAAAVRRDDDERTVPTYNVVHSEEIGVGELLRAFEDILPVALTIGSDPVSDPTALERIIYDALPGFLPYLNHERHYVPGRLAQLNVPCPSIDRAYIVRSIQPREARLP
jgi:hypothetical protein